MLPDCCKLSVLLAAKGALSRATEQGGSQPPLPRPCSDFLPAVCSDPARFRCWFHRYAAPSWFPGSWLPWARLPSGPLTGGACPAARGPSAGSSPVPRAWGAAEKQRGLSLDDDRCRSPMAESAAAISVLIAALSVSVLPWRRPLLLNSTFNVSERGRRHRRAARPSPGPPARLPPPCQTAVPCRPGRPRPALLDAPMFPDPPAPPLASFLILPGRPPRPSLREGWTGVAFLRPGVVAFGGLSAVSNEDCCFLNKEQFVYRQGL